MKALVPFALLAAACAPVDRLIPAPSPIDGFVELHELDRRGETRRLGSDTHLPDPATVDLDSTILVTVHPEKLRPAEGVGADPSALQRASESLTRLLREQEKLLALQEEAVAAFRATRSIAMTKLKGTEEHKRFREFKKKFGAAEQAFLVALDKEYPDGHPRRKALEAAPTPRAFLEEELRAVERQAADLKSKIAVTIRMWAWLDGPSPIHLEHYDTLAEGALQRRDRWGLRLSDQERRDLLAAMEANGAMVDILERLRRGEITARDAVRDALGPRVAEFADRLVALLKSATSWDERFERLRDELRTLATTANGKALLAKLEERIPHIGRLAAIHREILALRDDWRSQAFDRVLARAIALLSEIDGFLKTVDLEGAVENVIAEIAKEVGAAWAASGAKPVAESFLADAKAALEILDLAKDLLEVGRRGASEVLPPAQALKVPLNDTKNTRIELERTPRRDGDRVTLKWEMLEGEKVIDDGRASFEVRFLGHHASLEPSVIFATPSRMEGGDSDDFHFAPMLSWMHRYTPEPDDAGVVRVALGFLDAAIGPHAVFLNFDPDKEVEIGLGGTFSLWNDVLQIGGGWNLMAESVEEGGVYFFIGSSLIGLLQAVGLDPGKKAATTTR